MKKIGIKLEYNSKTYQSDYTEVNEKEEKALKELLESAVKGELNYLTFEHENILQYFSKKILVRSVLGLVYF